MVYGWLDTDGMGCFVCPENPLSPAGLVRVGDFPSHQVHITLVLDENRADQKPCIRSAASTDIGPNPI